MSMFEIFVVFIAVWLLVVSGVVVWFVSKLSKLIKGSGGVGLVKTLEKVIDREQANKKDIDKLEKELAVLREDGLLHIQKVGLVRFNPFNETGGDHSFSLALLDNKGSGFVLTGLHTRERTRLYIKPVKKQKSEYELSSEEKKALEKALKEKI